MSDAEFWDQMKRNYERRQRQPSGSIIDPLTGKLNPVLVSNGTGGTWDASRYVNDLVDDIIENDEEFERGIGRD